MFRIEFTLRTSFIQQYTLVLPAALLLLTFLGQVNKLYIFGAPYAAGCIILGKIDHVCNALLFCGLGLIMDVMYLIFHKSTSGWMYIKAFQFIMRLLICLFELACIIAIYCYLKQEETIRENKEKLNWIEKRLEDVMPKSKKSEQPKSPVVEKVKKPGWFSKLKKTNDDKPTSSASPIPATEYVPTTDDPTSTPLQEPINDETNLSAKTNQSSPLQKNSETKTTKKNTTTGPSNSNEKPIGESSNKK